MKKIISLISWSIKLGREKNWLLKNLMILIGIFLWKFSFAFSLIPFADYYTHTHCHDAEIYFLFWQTLIGIQIDVLSILLKHNPY